MGSAAAVSAKRLAKRMVIRSGLEAIALSGAARLAPRAGGRGMVFTLHHVRPSRGHAYEPNGHLSITPEFLDEAILTAKNAGLVPVHLHDLPGLLADRRDTRRFMAFTLDDGFRDNADFAAPVFRRHRVPYTIFITPGFVDRSRSMWWETAEALTRGVTVFRFDFGSGEETVPCRTTAEKLDAYERLADFVLSVPEDEAVSRIDHAARGAGVDPLGIVENEIMNEHELRAIATDPLASLGAHTITHPNLARLDEVRVRRELEESATLVGRYAGRRPTTLAFPYGMPSAAGPREAAIARALGFTVAATTRPGVLDSAAPEVMTFLPRVSLNGHFQKARYVRALVSGLPFRLM